MFLQCSGGTAIILNGSCDLSCHTNWVIQNCYTNTRKSTHQKYGVPTGVPLCPKTHTLNAERGTWDQTGHMECWEWEGKKIRPSWKGPGEICEVKRAWKQGETWLVSHTQTAERRGQRRKRNHKSAFLSSLDPSKTPVPPLLSSLPPKWDFVWQRHKCFRCQAVSSYTSSLGSWHVDYREI